MSPLLGNTALRQALISQGFASSDQGLESLVLRCTRILDIDQILQMKADFYEQSFYALNSATTHLLTLAKTEPQKWAQEVATCTHLAIQGSHLRLALAQASRTASNVSQSSLASLFSYIAVGALACTAAYALYAMTRDNAGVLPLTKRVIRRVAKVRRTHPPLRQEPVTPLAMCATNQEPRISLPDDEAQKQWRLEEEWRKRRDLVISGKL